MSAGFHLIGRCPARSAAIALLEREKLPASDLTDEHLEQFFYVGLANAPTALVGLELFGPVALLRSLAVRGDARAAGIGTALVTHAENHARSQGARSLYLLTTTAEAFFARRGYARIGRAAAPAAVQSTREFTSLCPASSAFMFKAL